MNNLRWWGNSTLKFGVNGVEKGQISIGNSKTYSGIWQ